MVNVLAGKFCVLLTGSYMGYLMTAGILVMLSPLRIRNMIPTRNALNEPYVFT